MSNPEDIVIPRTELPGALTLRNQVIVDGIPDVYASSFIAKESRKMAHRYIARAEAIDEFLAAQADEALREEAIALSNRVDNVPLDTLGVNLNYWTKIARAAREVYGVK